MKKKSHKRMMDGGMAEEAARGRRAPSRMASPAIGRGDMEAVGPGFRTGPKRKPNIPFGRARPGERGSPVKKDDMVYTMPVKPPVKKPMPGAVAKIGDMNSIGVGPVSTTTLPIAGRGAAAPGGMDAMKPVPMVGMKKGGAVKSKKMRGGGLARKGVGMALAAGGLAKRAGGCAKRGIGRGKIT